MEQDTLFNKIRSFYQTKRRMPNYREIMNLAGYKSTNAAHKLVERMREDGLVEKDRSGKLIPTPAFNQIPILGYVEAGWPSPAEEELVDRMNLDDYLIRNWDSTYILKVKGDSMQDAGIMPGDMVLAERGAGPRDGSIVIAEVDGEWTMKYFRKKIGKIFLEPANKKYRPIIPRQSLKIAAIVRAVIRKY